MKPGMKPIRCYYNRSVRCKQQKNAHTASITRLIWRILNGCIAITAQKPSSTT